MSVAWRILLFVLAVCALAMGMLGGLARLGLAVPAASQAGNHGVFMVCGVFGTLISLERAVAMARPWPYLAPLLAGMGSVALSISATESLAPLLFVGAACVLCIASIQLYRQQAALHLATLGIGAALWLFGNLVWWQSQLVILAVPAWQAFLVLTIAGERLELSRFMKTPPGARRSFAAVVFAIAGSALLSPFRMDEATPLFAASLLGLVGWLLRYDIVRITLRQSSLPRYIAVCLYAGYIWLAISALLMLGGSFWLETPLRDAALHSMLLGFVLSMVFGHAPIILPAVTRLRLPYQPVLYLPLLLLHASLAARVAASVIDNFQLKQIAAECNVAALLLFAATVVFLLLRRKID